MDSDPQPVGGKADGVLDAVEPIERVERRLGVEDHPPFGVDAGAARGEQVVDILLLDAVAAEFAFDRRDVAEQAAGREADPYVVDVETGDADRKSGVSGKSVAVRLDLGGCRIIKK